MNKVSWPYTGSAEAEMGSMSPKGDYSDIEGPNDFGDFSTQNYGLLDHQKSSGPEHQVPTSYSEGMLSPLQDSADDMEADDKEDEDLDVLASAFCSLMRKGSNILGIGRQSIPALNSLAARGHNVVSLQKDAYPHGVNLLSFPVEASDPMFYKGRYKLDGVLSESSFDNAEVAEISLRNIYSQMRPMAYGLIVSNGSFDLETIVKKCNFEIIKKHSGETTKFLIKKNDLNKIAVIRYYNLDKKELSIFECDVADTHMERTIGLQAYSGLLDRCGLIFKYSRPTDVMFHMGTVNFPIDVAFLDENDTVVKLCRNIEPGSLEIFGSANTKTVLELSAGAAKEIGIEIGEKLFLNYGEQISETFKKESRILEAAGLDRCIYKESSYAENSFYNLYNFNLYLKNSENTTATSLIKNAKNYNVEKTKVICYDLNFIFDSKEASLYRREETSDLTKIAVSLFGETFSTKGDFIRVSEEALIENGFFGKINRKYALDALKYARSINANEHEDLYLKRIYKDSSNILSKISFIYRGDLNIKLATELLNAKIRGITQDESFSLNADFIRVPRNFDDNNCLSALASRYPNCSTLLRAGELSKAAGAPVSDHTKEVAKKAARYFSRAKDSCTELADNLNQNVSVYQQLADKPGVIKNSKGEYRESCKRNSKIAKKCLLNIQEGIRILNEIQDASTTEEIISSIAGSSKSFSDSIKDVFDLSDNLGSPDFVQTLDSNTGITVIALKDLRTILDRAKEYITKNILGMIILSN